MMLEHERAKSAYHEVATIRDDLKSRKNSPDKFKSWAKKFPMMLQACGLLQTTAFYEDNGKEVHDVLKKWLQSRFPRHFSDNKKAVTHVISGLDMASYRLMFRETMAYMTWVKRAASVLMDEPAAKKNEVAP